MTTIRNQERLDKIIEAAGKWYDPVNRCISRRMKDPEKLIEYADKIAQLYFIPNALNGRGDYRGRYEYRTYTETFSSSNTRTTEYYFAIITDDGTGKDTPATGVATIQKDGEFWYYELHGLYIHKDKPMLFY